MAFTDAQVRAQIASWPPEKHAWVKALADEEVNAFFSGSGAGTPAIQSKLAAIALKPWADAAMKRPAAAKKVAMKKAPMKGIKKAMKGIKKVAMKKAPTKGLKKAMKKASAAADAGHATPAMKKTAMKKA